jgi:cation transport ATPase
MKAVPTVTGDDWAVKPADPSNENGGGGAIPSGAAAVRHLPQGPTVRSADESRSWRERLWGRRQLVIATIALAGIAAHLILRFAVKAPLPAHRLPLLIVLAAGGAPLVFELLVKLYRRQFGSDLLAGISIVTSVLLGEHLAGAIVVLMLSGGEALETFAVRSASSVLRALANRMPSVAHRKTDAGTADVALAAVAVDDTLLVYPHEICPVDGVVIDGHGSMDESYLTGEPYRMSKTPGSDVLSGAINGDAALTIRATKLAVDSRYAKIVQVLRGSEQDAPHLRRLGDQLGAYYTPLAVAIALVAWWASGRADRFLAVLVVATPCPLLIAIPVAIIGSVSLAARRGIIVKKPVVLEQVAACRTLIFDKTGTLTYGEPRLAELSVAPRFDRAGRGRGRGADAPGRRRGARAAGPGPARHGGRRRRASHQPEKAHRRPA